jgi:hypothetical protein
MCSPAFFMGVGGAHFRMNHLPERMISQSPCSAGPEDTIDRAEAVLCSPPAKDSVACRQSFAVLVQREVDPPCHGIEN